MVKCFPNLVNSPTSPKKTLFGLKWRSFVAFQPEMTFFRKILPAFGELQLGGVARAPQQQLNPTPGWVCGFRSLSRTNPLSPSSVFTSQTQSKLYYMDCFYSNCTTKSRAKKPGPFLPLTSCWTFFRSLCLMTSQLQALMKCGCDR